LLVSLAAEPSPSTTGYTIEETVPPGSRVTQISSSGVYDPLKGTLTFGPFPDAQPRQLIYEVLLPSTQIGPLNFNGRILDQGDSMPVLGPRTTESAAFHPADVGTAVFSISWPELNAYARAWRTGADWPAAPVGIPIEYLTAAGKIWSAGGIYSVSRSMTNAPALWLEPSRSNGIPSQATLLLPDLYVPGEPFTLELILKPDSAAGCAAAEIQLPLTWTVANLSERGEHDLRANAVRWGPFFGNAARVLSCKVLPEAVSLGEPEIEPTVSIDGQLVPVTGRTAIPLPGQLTVRPMADAVRLMFGSEPDRQFRVWTSTDLITWEPIRTLTSTNGVYLWAEPIQPPASSRFYRVTPVGNPP
jgi:hypothetical protein